MERRKLWAYYKNYVDKYKERLKNFYQKERNVWMVKPSMALDLHAFFSNVNFDGR